MYGKHLEGGGTTEIKLTLLRMVANVCVIHMGVLTSSKKKMVIKTSYNPPAKVGKLILFL